MPVDLDSVGLGVGAACCSLDEYRLTPLDIAFGATLATFSGRTAIRSPSSGTGIRQGKLAQRSGPAHACVSTLIGAECLAAGAQDASAIWSPASSRLTRDCQTAHVTAAVRLIMAPTVLTTFASTHHCRSSVRGHLRHRRERH